MKKKKAFYAEVTGPKRVVKYLQAYYLQGGKWHKVKKVKGL
jgi:hypothetical protein